MIDAEAQLRGSIAPMQPGTTLSKPVGEQFLKQLAEVSRDLAADDAVAAVKAGQRLRELAEALGETGDGQVDQLLARLRQIPKNPAGNDLKALRQSFLPWSTTGAELALALKRGGQNPEVTVFECPMTGDSFPGRALEGEVGSVRLRNPQPVFWRGNAKLRGGGKALSSRMEGTAEISGETARDRSAEAARQPHFLADRLVFAESLPGGLRHVAHHRLGYLGCSPHPVDAIPDLSENQVIVFADWSGAVRRKWKIR